MRHAIDRMGTKGSVLVLKKGKVWLNYAKANKADTSYLINSVQKSMTATMVMREVQKGKLKLSTPLSHFYPTVAGNREVKIANLIDMTSGLDLKRGTQLGTPKYISDKANLQSDMQKTVFDNKKLGKWHYSAVNYVYLCGILTKLEHKSYEQLFRQTYINPLNLSHTEFLWASKDKLKASHWVPGYQKTNGVYKKVPLKQAVKDAHNELGAGSIVMSNKDLAKTIQDILTGNLLTKKSRQVLFKGKAPKYYNGGFYNLPDYKLANGAGEGYYTFMRTTANGQEMIIVQSNHTKKGQFVKLRKKANQIMSLMLRLK